MKKYSLPVLLLLWAINAQATVVHQPSDCGQWGQFDTTANLQIFLPASNAECSYASSQDQGALYSNGTSWVPLGGTNASIGTPTSRTLSLGTAFQATTTSKAAIVTVNLSSSASLTLSGGATNTATIVIGSTNGVASGTGTTVGNYSNSLTGTLVVGVTINTVSTSPVTFAHPAGWFFAVRQTSGTVTITSAFDQSIG